jgi:hypothetical protein
MLLGPMDVNRSIPAQNDIDRAAYGNSRLVLAALPKYILKMHRKSTQHGP